MSARIRLAASLIAGPWVVAVLAWPQPIASAATPGPAWTIRSLATPTDFSAGDNINCENIETCDGYTVLATNTGSKPTDGTSIAIADSLPPGVTVKEVSGIEWERREPLECTPAPLRCTYERPIAPDDTLQMTITVEVTAGAGTVTNEAGVTGGGAGAQATSEQTVVEQATAPFGVQDLPFTPTALDGSREMQAGRHPYELITGFDLASRVSRPPEVYLPSEEMKDAVVYLPPGFLGDPQATPRCPLALLENAQNDYNSESPTFGQRIPKCPSASKVGIVDVASGAFGTRLNSIYVGSLYQFSGASSVFNMIPEAGHPAELGFVYASNVVLMYPELVRTRAGYQLRVDVPGLPLVHVLGTTVTLFGQPGVRDGEQAATASFLTNPTRCTNEPLTTRIEADSWERPGQWTSREAVAYPHVSGCGSLKFEPEIQVGPDDTTHADTPAGYEVNLKVPGAATPWSVPQAPEVRDVTMTLPAGVSLSAAAADGLESCAETGPHGINIATGVGPRGESLRPDEIGGEGEAIGPDGLSHLARGHCPPASQIGDVEVETPLLPPHTLSGRVYVAQPECEPCSEADAREGRMFGLYLEIEGAGVNVKLRGRVFADPSTGRLTARFEENPQLPFSELKLHLDGGPRAPLANPQTCGAATTTSDLTPWSAPETPDAMPSSSFEVIGCGASMPFAPAFSAGTVTPIGGGFSPFTLTLSRSDGEQDLAGITVRTPPGLLGKIAGVPLCGEPQAQLGTCPAASRIGTANVAAGAGSHPFWLSGQVYLTGPYKGAPFGLSVVVPEKAGPFDLGEEVVRSAIRIDPHTSAIAITSDPLPQIKDGVPFRLKTINVTVDRPGFIFNPTNCEAQHISATVAGEHPIGSSEAPKSAQVSSPFAAASCKNLPFKPVFTASTQAKTSRMSGASLVVKVTAKPGEANIRKVDLQLPKALPSRLATLHLACGEAQFAANPAGCPVGSNIGTAVAHTPVLNAPLSGPAYLVSHGGAAFPDVVFVLQGEGVTIELIGNTDIKKGITYSKFDAVPDAPISSFETRLPEGPHSILAANLPARARGSLCGQTLTLPMTITGQNGAVIAQKPRIAVAGCHARKRARRRHPKAKHAHARR